MMNTRIVSVVLLAMLFGFSAFAEDAAPVEKKKGKAMIPAAKFTTMSESYKAKAEKTEDKALAETFQTLSENYARLATLKTEGDAKVANGAEADWTEFETLRKQTREIEAKVKGPAEKPKGEKDVKEISD